MPRASQFDSANVWMRLSFLLILCFAVTGVALASEDAPQNASIEIAQHEDPQAQDPHGEASQEEADHAADDDHAETAGHADEGDTHGEEHGDGEHQGEQLELPHLIMVARQFIDPASPLAHYTHVFENAFFAILAGTLLCLVASRVYKHRRLLPDRLQAAFELILEFFQDLAVSMMGEKYGRHYTPFVTTIFVYLLAMNYSALIPLGKAPTSTWLNNFSIAICVFLYVQYTGIKRNGIGGYLHHLAGSPKDTVGWAISPLIFALELFGEFVKPVSLSLRLFGNIFGEDMLLAVFALLGVVVLSGLGVPIGIPLHLPFLFLSLLLGLIQALVFSLLATVYLSLMLPHDHGEHAEAH